LHTLLYANPTDAITIQTAIANKYLQMYPSLHIDKLHITPLGKMPKQFSNYHIENIFLSSASLKRNRGTFSVLFANNKKKKKRFYKFFLQGTIGVYKTIQPMKREQLLNHHYLAYQEIAFKNLSSMPIDESYFYNYVTKRSIKKGKVLTKHDVKRLLDIKRGKLIDATLYDGNVKLTFKVKALEEGNIGEIIKVKRGYYKKFSAQITSKTSVDIIE
jgi:flagella basal body P-ring formation protein FlgA